MNEIVKMEAVRQLEAAVKKAAEAAEKLLKCAESLSNPTYSVSMQGHAGELEILAVRHFQGQIVLMIKSPFSEAEIHRAELANQQRNALGYDDVL